MEVALALDANSPVALYRQIYNGLREGIVSGRFEGGSRLPASRAFANSLGVSRITVTECYDQLISEGYLETRLRSGTFVCTRVPEENLHAFSATIDNSAQGPRHVPVRLSRYGALVNTPLLPKVPNEVIRLDRPGPDVSYFPKKLWTHLWVRRMQEDCPALLQYTQEFTGDTELRIAVARYLQKSRAVVCDPSQIIIVTGSQQAIYLTARVLLDESDCVAVENPGYRYASKIFASQGAKILPIPVDKDGMQIAQLKKHHNKSPKLVYITPSHQYPRGVSLSVSRRIELLHWASDVGSLILEDDYDSEYRYTERPIPSLQGMAPNTPVIYVGTFSKLLFPSLRLGYLVVPPGFQHVFARAKLLCDIQSSSLDQSVLADFINEGHLEPYIRKMRVVYSRKRALLIESLRRHFGNRITIYGDEAGMHFLADFQTDLSEPDAFDRVSAAGVRVERLYWHENPPIQQAGHVQFIFGFAAIGEGDLVLAAKRIANAISF